MWSDLSHNRQIVYLNKSDTSNYISPLFYLSHHRDILFHVFTSAMPGATTSNVYKSQQRHWESSVPAILPAILAPGGFCTRAHNAVIPKNPAPRGNAPSRCCHRAAENFGHF